MSGTAAPGLADAALELAKEFWIKAKLIEANPFGSGQLAIADIGRAIAYRDAAKQLRALVTDPPPSIADEKGCACYRGLKPHEHDGDEDGDCRVCGCGQYREPAGAGL